MDVYRNNVLILNTANDGSYADTMGGGGHGSFTHKVCELGTQTCSKDATPQARSLSVHVGIKCKGDTP